MDQRILPIWGRGGESPCGRGKVEELPEYMGKEDRCCRKVRGFLVAACLCEREVFLRGGGKENFCSGEGRERNELLEGNKRYPYSWSKKKENHPGRGRGRNGPCKGDTRNEKKVRRGQGERKPYYKRKKKKTAFAKVRSKRSRGERRSVKKDSRGGEKRRRNRGKRGRQTTMERTAITKEESSFLKKQKNSLRVGERGAQQHTSGERKIERKKFYLSCAEGGRFLRRGVTNKSRVRSQQEERGKKTGYHLRTQGKGRSFRQKEEVPAKKGTSYCREEGKEG